MFVLNKKPQAEYKVDSFESCRPKVTNIMLPYLPVKDCEHHYGSKTQESHHLPTLLESYCIFQSSIILASNLKGIQGTPVDSYPVLSGYTMC